MKNGRIDCRIRFSNAPGSLGSSATAKKFVASDPYGIGMGYIEKSAADSGVKVVLTLPKELVVIALIVTPEGLPLTYGVLSGNTTDATTLRQFPRERRAHRRAGQAQLVRSARQG